MSNQNTTVRTCLLTISLITVVTSWAVAQGVKPQPVNRTVEKYGERSEKAEGGDIIRIRKLSGGGRPVLEKTPDYKTTAPRGIKPAGDWAQISLTYDTAPEWIDELTFQYYVMTSKTEDGKKAFSLFKTTVKYIDIEKGRDHMSAVYLRPGALKRFGSVVAAAVEISVGGKVIADRSETDSEIKMSEKWWMDPKVVESKNLTVRDGYLLDRSQSPFALVNIDDYEVSK